MKKALILFFAALSTAFVIHAAGFQTNVVTNVAYEVRVKWETFSVTNGYTETYSGTLITNKVYDTPQWIWKDGNLALVTNSFDMIVGGTTTNRVYDITYGVRPIYYPVAVTNVYTNGLSSSIISQ